MVFDLSNLTGSTLRGLEKALDLGWRRNEAITSNIANAETPMYRAIDLDFGSELEASFGRNTSTLVKTHQSHLDTKNSGKALFVEDLSGVTKNDGNNVDIDIQMGRLAYNSSKFSLASTLLRRELQTLASAIRLVG